jgi:hypothetical protein
LARSAQALAAPFLDRSLAVNLKVTSLSEKPFRIEGVSDPEGAVVGFAHPDETGWIVVLLLAGKPKTSRGKISLTTDRKDQPSIDVRYGVRSMSAARKHPKGMRGRSMPPIGLDPARRLGKDGKRLKLAPRMQRSPLKAKPRPKMIKPKPRKPRPGTKAPQ